MKRFSLFLAFAISLFLATCSPPAYAIQKSSGPGGWLNFCERAEFRSFFCTPRPIEEVEDNARNREMLRAVNNFVNALMPPVSDQKNYGVSEYWNIPPAGQGGDCEDYALSKMLMLRQSGFPASALVIVAGFSRIVPQNHAVLGVHIGGEIVILDNLTSEIYPRGSSALIIKLVQNRDDPMLWDRLQ